MDSTDKNNEDLTKEPQTIFSNFFDSVPITTLLLDKDRKIRKLNQTAINFTGTHVPSVSDMTGLFLGEAFNCSHLSDDSRGCGFGPRCQNCKVRNYVLDSLEDGTSHYHKEADLSFAHGNGTIEEKSILISSIPLLVENEEFALVSVIDITELKSVEERLMASEKKYRDLIDHIPVIVYFSDIKHTSLSLYISHKIRDSFGFSLDDFNNNPDFLKEHIHPDDREHMALELEKAVKTDGNFVSEYRVIIKDERIVWFRDEAIIVRDKNGNPLYLQGLMFDITDHKFLEEEKIKNQKLESSGIICRGLAHDFNNLLTFLLGNISLVKTSLRQEKGDNFKILKEAEDACTSLRKLGNQFLLHSEEGKFLKEVISISKRLKGAVTFALRGSNVKCKFRIPVGIKKIRVNKTQFYQVIDNLVINAMQAMPRGGEIELSVRNVYLKKDNSFSLKNGKYVRIAIKDHGVGISKRDLKNIFKPYFSMKQKGFGLGLSTSFTIIKRHMGHISVESELKKGTTFYIYLPAYTGKRKRNKKHTEKSPAKTFC